MKEVVKLPRYMVEKSANGYTIWDTFKHETLKGKFETKDQAGHEARNLEAGHKLETEIRKTFKL